MGMVAKAATADALHPAYRGNGRVYNVLSDNAVSARLYIHLLAAAIGLVSAVEGHA
jgi:hypothetical protein